MIDASETPLYAELEGGTTFRLMKLEPGDAHQTIVVSLITVDSASALQYDALSYVWGDLDRTTNINCNGRSITVTINLHWALTRVRKVDQPSLVWADAICINQQDVQERSHQVSIMGTIYSNARTVYICVGDDWEGGTSDVLSLLKDLKPRLAEDINSESSSLDDFENDKRWAAVGTLSRRPWFRRAWVLQEAGLAANPRVRYGEIEFSYRDLIAALQWFNRRVWSTKYDIELLLVHLQWSNWREAPARSQYTFLDLLSHTALLDCSDPRDYVYSILGHPMAQLKDGSGPLVKPDYSKDQAALFLNLTRALLQRDGLRVLSMVEHNESTIHEDSPSWMVRWNVSDVSNDIDQVGRHFNASISSNAHYFCENTTLVLQGLEIDTVQSSYQAVKTWEKDMTFLDASKNAQSTIEQLLKSISSEYGNQSVGEICQTLCAGFFPHGIRPYTSADILTLGLGHHQDVSSKAEQQEHDHVLEFWRPSMHLYSTGRSFIVTHRGHFALGPRITQPGDKCYVIQGAKVPLILRPFPGNRSKLLGESYVHGFMEGQIEQYAAAKQLKWDSVVLF